MSIKKEVEWFTFMEKTPVAGRPLLVTGDQSPESVLRVVMHEDGRFCMAVSPDVFVNLANDFYWTYVDSPLKPKYPPVVGTILMWHRFEDLPPPHYTSILVLGPGPSRKSVRVVWVDGDGKLHGASKDDLPNPAAYVYWAVITHPKELGE